jgi:hypothetical protein
MVLHRALHVLELAHEERARYRDGQAAHPPRAELVGGRAGDVLGQDVCPAPHREVRHGRHARGLDRDVGGRVADAEHQHVLVDEALVGLAVVVRVDLLAGEAVLAREGRLGVLRIPVMAVGHHDGVVDGGATVAQGHAPPAVPLELDGGDLGAKADAAA